MKDLGTKTLETERLILRKFELNDVEELFYNGYITDEIMTKNMSWSPCKNIEEQYNIIKNGLNSTKIMIIIDG